VAPERIIGLLAKWAGLHDGTAAKASELVSYFSLQRLPRNPVRVTEQQVREHLDL
jgi:hypothetical protein